MEKLSPWWWTPQMKNPSKCIVVSTGMSSIADNTSGGVYAYRVRCDLPCFFVSTWKYDGFRQVQRDERYIEVGRLLPLSDLVLWYTSCSQGGFFVMPHRRAPAAVCFACFRDCSNRASLLQHVKYKSKRCLRYWVARFPVMPPEQLITQQEETNCVVRANIKAGENPNSADSPSVDWACPFVLLVTQ